MMPHNAKPVEIMVRVEILYSDGKRIIVRRSEPWEVASSMYGLDAYGVMTYEVREALNQMKVLADREQAKKDEL